MVKWSKIKRRQMIIKIDKPYIGGELRGADFILELPKRKKITITKISKKPNPDRLNIFTIPFKEGHFSIVYYKNSNRFWGMYQGGVHNDLTELSESYVYNILYNLLYKTVRKKKLRGQAIQSMHKLMERNIRTIKSWKKPFDINKVKKDGKNNRFE